MAIRESFEGGRLEGVIRRGGWGGREGERVPEGVLSQWVVYPGLF